MTVTRSSVTIRVLSSDTRTGMPTVRVKENEPFEVALRRFKRTVEQDRKDVSEAEIVSVIEKMIKQRRDSISQFQAANRQDLVEVETFELNLLSGYLPKQLTDVEIAEEVSAAIGQTGAKGVSDMGKVMGALKGKLAGRADMGKISSLVKSKLAG